MFIWIPHFWARCLWLMMSVGFVVEVSSATCVFGVCLEWLSMVVVFILLSSYFMYLCSMWQCDISQLVVLRGMVDGMNRNHIPSRNFETSWVGARDNCGSTMWQKRLREGQEAEKLHGQNLSASLPSWSLGSRLDANWARLGPRTLLRAKPSERRDYLDHLHLSSQPWKNFLDTLGGP